jgi:hypothetical protein
MILKRKGHKRDNRQNKKAHPCPHVDLERMDPNVFGGWFSALGGFKMLIGAMGLILRVRLILPCLAPLMLRSIKTIMEANIERKMATHVMMLWKYTPLDQGSLTPGGSEHQRGE